MPVTREQVERVLRMDEPDYNAAAKLGVGALVHLERVVREEGTAMAVKAVYLAALIGEDGLADAAVELASRRREPVLRVAAAAALVRVSAGRLADIAERLVVDPDEGVARKAVGALCSDGRADMAGVLSSLADRLPIGARHAILREAARRGRGSPK